MNKLEDYKKYIGGYIRNQFGIAKITGVFEQDGIIYLKLDKCIVFDVDRKDGNIILNHATRDTYPITEYTQNLDERIKPLIELIEPGDIVLYKDGTSARIMETTDKHFLISEYATESQFYEKKDIVMSDIESIITHEKLNEIKYII